MFQTSEPYYSEKAMLKLLKNAPIEKLMEYLLMKTRMAEDGSR